MNEGEAIRRIAEVEFSQIVVQVDDLGAKLRVLLTDASFIDVWVSRKLPGRFGFHWERRHLDGHIFRYDNFPDTDWATVSTFPYHFHNDEQALVVAAPFSAEPIQGFREFMEFVSNKIAA